MFDVTKIQTGLYGAVGFRQPLNPDLPTITAANIESRSGRFVTDDPYVKIDYLKDNTDFVGIDDTQFNTYLEQLQKSAIAEVCGSVFNQTDYIDRQMLYKNANNKVNTVNLPDGFVGYKIQVDSDKNIAFEIKRVMLEFNGTGTLKLMLFNTAKSTPIESKDIAITSTHQVEQLNWKVDNSDDTYKGEYYLGYRSNDANLNTLEPFARDYENADILSNITHLCMFRMYFPTIATDTLADLTTEDGLSDDIGINPDIIVYEDYTDLIIQNETLLSYAIYLQLCIRCSSTYLASLRSNRNEREAERVILRVIQHINGQEGEGIVKIEGLKMMLTTEMSAIRREIDKQKKGLFPSEMTTHTLT